MYIPGHLSVAYLITHTRQLPSSLRVWWWTVVAPACLGSVTPDLVDKPLHWFLNHTYGRSVGHSLAVWMLVSAALAPIEWPNTALRRCVRWWLIGAWSHLLIDTINDALAGVLFSRYLWSAWWAWPWLTPDDWQCKITNTLLEPCKRCWTPLEIAVIAFAVGACLWRCWALVGRSTQHDDCE